MKALINACRWGNRKVAEWLYQLSKTKMHDFIDIRSRGSKAFKHACINGYLEMAEWLYEMGEQNAEPISNKLIESILWTNFRDVNSW